MAEVYRVIFRASKVIHKYVGLVCLVYFVLMGISGVLLNHPSLIRRFAVPISWMPASYVYHNWNRMALREAVLSTKYPGTLYIGGKTGVWESNDSGQSFSLLHNQFPRAVYDMDTRCILLTETDVADYLYAGTRTGLYRYDFTTDQWRRIDGDATNVVDVVDIVQAGQAILVFTPSAAYRLEGSKEAPFLTPLTLTSTLTKSPTVPLFRFLLKLHDGSLLGLPGKLFMDLIGLILIFLSASALYLWYIPWRKKRLKRRMGRPRFFRLFHKYHLKLGIYAAFFLGVIALTGIFIRPPFLKTIMRYSVSTRWLNNATSDQAWPWRTAKVIYKPQGRSLLIATRNGFFQGPVDFSKPFAKIDVQAPVHGMGITALAALPDQKVLIGSFSGLYIWDENINQATDLQGRPAPARKGGRPTAGHGMVAGAGVKNGALRLWADYRKGIVPIDSSLAAIQMPDAVVQHSGMSLWHFLFEVHNGRIFRGWLGRYTWLIVPVGGLVLILTLLTGSYDWFYRKVLARRRLPAIHRYRKKSSSIAPLIPIKKSQILEE